MPNEPFAHFLSSLSWRAMPEADPVTQDLLDLLETLTEIRVEQLDLRSSVLASLRLVHSLEYLHSARLYLTNRHRIYVVVSQGQPSSDETEETAYADGLRQAELRQDDQGDHRVRVLRVGRRCYGILILEQCPQAVAALLSDLFLQWCAVAEFIATQKEELIDENYQLREEIRVQYSDRNVIGISGSFENVMAAASRVAASSATVLIEGETGTGKELIARRIHDHSPRSNKPFITINCGALSESLLESELFGHVKGAFTGAVSNRKGRFEAANGGTIFLDEIGEISPHMQVRLLRVLQELEVVRVGDHQIRKLDVRVIAATNRSLEKEVQQEHFRSDLYYRLNVVYLHMPPLRERQEDIPLLIEHFLGVYGQRNLKYIEHIHRDVIDAMKRYPWPGNVRELENCVEKMVVMAPRGEITSDLLPMALMAYTSPELDGASLPEPTQPVGNGAEAGALEPAMQQYLGQETHRCLEERRSDLYQLVRDKWERHLFEVALEVCRDNKTKAADLLGITRTTLNKRLRLLSEIKRDWKVD